MIADLHLDVDAGPSAEPVLEFLAFLERAHGAPALVVLGDLFEYWLGKSQANSPGGRAVLTALAGFPGALYFVPGNRDVLAGSELEATGLTLAPDGLVAEVGEGERLLLLHGDELCIRDASYLRLRRWLRRPAVRVVLRALPATVGRGIAQRLRSHSKKAVPAKAPLDVTQDLGEAALRLRAAFATQLVVGHAHAFRDVVLESERGSEGQVGGRFCVLDAFGGDRDTLRIGKLGQLEFVSSRDLSGSPR